MTRATAIATVAMVAVCAGSALAQPAPPQPPSGPTVIVLRLDRGPGVDAALSERVQKEIEQQAQAAGLQVTTGTENLTDTAAVAGCTAKVVADCGGSIIDALGVDEIVYGSVDRSMSGPHVTVSRARKGMQPTRISVDVPDGDPEAAAKALHPALDGLFPIDGTATGGGVGDGTGAGTGAGDGTGTGAGTGAEIGPGGGIETDRHPVDTRKVVAIGGIAAGGAMLITGLACWLKASSLNGDIDDAPRDTLPELLALHDLEDRAAGYAQWGNILVVLGVVVGGGTATWWYYKGRRSQPTPTTASARIDPWLAPGGGGVTLTWSTP